jgi:uncharacterized protein YwqG
MLKQLKEKLAIIESKVEQYEEDSKGISEIDFRCQLEDEIGILEEEFSDLEDSEFEVGLNPHFQNIKKRINKIKEEYGVVTSIDIEDELDQMFPNHGDDDE